MIYMCIYIYRASALSWQCFSQPLEGSICFSPLNDHCFHIQHVKMSLSLPLLQISNRIIQSSPVATKTKQKAEGERWLTGRDGERGRFWNSFSISWTWGQEFRANKNKNKMFQPDPISSQRGGFKARNTLPQLVPVPHVCLFLWRSSFSPHSRVSDSRPGRRKEFRSKGNTLYSSLGSASTLRSHRTSDLMLRCSLHKGPMKLN